MAKKRVLAYFMHEHEQAAAAASLENADVTDSFVCGDIDDTKIKELEAKGLVVQMVTDEVPEPVAEAMPRGMAAGPSPRAMRVARARAGIRASGCESPGDTARGPAGAAPAPAKESFYVVGFDGPVLPRVQKSFRDLGVSLDERLDKGQYVVKLRPDQVAAVENLGFTELKPFDETETELASAETPPADVPNTGSIQMLTYDVLLHDATFLDQTSQEIKALGLQIAGAKGRKIRYYVLATDAAEHEQNVRALEGVRKAEQYIEPQLHNDVARVLLGIDPATNPGAGMLRPAPARWWPSPIPSWIKRIPTLRAASSAYRRWAASTMPPIPMAMARTSPDPCWAAARRRPRSFAAPHRQRIVLSITARQQGRARRTAARSERLVRRGVPEECAHPQQQLGIRRRRRVHAQLAGSRRVRGQQARHVDRDLRRQRRPGRHARELEDWHGRLAVDRRAGLVQERAHRRRIAVEPQRQAASRPSPTAPRGPGRFPTIPSPTETI